MNHIFYGVFAYISISVLLALLTYHNMAIGMTLIIAFFHLLHYKLDLRKLLFLLGCLSLSLSYIAYSFQVNHPNVKDEPFTTVMRITEYPVYDGNKMEAIVKGQGNSRYLLNYYLKSEKEKSHFSKKLRPGVLCKISVTMEEPSVSRNPNAFNYQLYLQSINIDGIFKTDQFLDCNNDTPTLVEKIKINRQSYIEKIEAAFPTSIAPIVTALVFGEKEKMDTGVIEDYQHLGISHLLAISGLHVGIFSAALFYILIRIHITRERATKIMLLVLPIYAILAGLGPSVNRAVFMTWCILFLSSRRIKIAPLDALGFSFVVFFILNPYNFYHVGFQLSYLVAASLVLSRSIINTSIGFLRSTITVSSIATLSSLPIILLHFYEINALTILVNLIFVPLYSTLILPLSFFTFSIISFVPYLSTPFVKILSAIITWSNHLAERLASFDEFTITLGKPPPWVLVIYFVCITIFYILLENNSNLKRWRYMTILLIPFLLHILVVKYSPVGEVTFLDVGQGDSVFIRLPFNQGNYLIDTGGVVSFDQDNWEKRKNPYDPGEKIVVPFLKSRGIATIDKLILTHGDSDHIGGAKAIIDDLKVKQLIVGSTLDKKELEQTIIEDSLEKKIEVVEVYRGLNWEKKYYTFQILSPEKFSNSSNDSSVVLVADIAGLTWLLTGDMEETGENKMINTYPDLMIDVLKAGHHGSNTSSSRTFINQIKPSTVIISVGENNRYGHPSFDVIQSFKEMNATIYRTDENGAITYSFFGPFGNFSTMIEK